jgi:hypothetical protein
MTQCGVVDVLKAQRQRAVIAQLDAALAALGTRGILLKGAAMLMRTPPARVARATTDIDILVDDAGAAAALRRRLLADGFDGNGDDRPTADHHLAPIASNGIDVEIHTRIMDRAWGLPEAEMIRESRALSAASALATLSPEGLVLHAVVHLTASFFAFGMKVAHDVRVVLADSPALDWARVARWASASRLPRAFWAPLPTLAHDLDVPVPPHVLALAPVDAGMRRLQLIARDRVPAATDGLLQLDALSRTMLMLLLHERASEGIAYLSRVVGFRTARPGTWGNAAVRAHRNGMFRHAWHHFRYYRELTRRERRA